MPLAPRSLSTHLLVLAGLLAALGLSGTVVLVAATTHLPRIALDIGGATESLRLAEEIRGSEDETMAQFTADVAGMLELFAIAAGLVLLHRADEEAPAKLLRAAGWVLVAGGIVVGACTTVYWFKYQSRGEFETVHMGYPGTMHAPGRAWALERWVPA